MRMRSYSALTTLLTLIAVFSFNYLLFAQNPLPKKVNRERKKFLENQINSDNKLFLDQLGLNFQYLSEITGHTLKMLKSLSSMNEFDYSKFVNTLQVKTKKIIPDLTGPKKSCRNFKRFMEKDLGKDSDLKSSFRRLLMRYADIERLKTSFKDDFTENLPTDGIYRYYTLCSNALENSPTEILEQIITIYEGLAETAKKHELGELKRLLPEKIYFLKESYNALEDDIVYRLRYSQSSWGRNIILQIIKLVQEQIIFDKDFAASVFNKLASIPTPINPKLPDFQVVSIGVPSTDTIKAGDKITLVVVVKNTGQLSASSSKTKVIFPNGKTKMFRVPKLSGGQTYLKTLRYRVARVEKSEFTVTVNSNSKAWESDTSNNIAKRALIPQ